MILTSYRGKLMLISHLIRTRQCSEDLARLEGMKNAREIEGTMLLDVAELYPALGVDEERVVILTDLDLPEDVQVLREDARMLRVQYSVGGGALYFVARLIPSVQSEETGGLILLLCMRLPTVDGIREARLRGWGA